MIDKEGFIKLFCLDIPNVDHFDYYLDQLSKSRKYSDIKSLASVYEEVESLIDDPLKFGEDRVKSISDFIEESDTWSELCYDRNLIDYPSSRTVKYSEGVKYLSISLKNSSWESLKKYDLPHINEIGNSYEDILSKFGLESPIFSESRHIRNLIFGAIDQRKINKVQRNIIQEVVREYQDIFTLESVRSDAIFSFENFSDLEVLNTLDKKYSIRIFTVKRVEDFRVDSLYNMSGDFLGKELFSIKSHLFFLKNKEYVTGDPLDVKDFFFRDPDGRLSILYDRRLKIDLI